MSKWEKKRPHRKVLNCSRVYILEWGVCSVSFAFGRNTLTQIEGRFSCSCCWKQLLETCALIVKRLRSFLRRRTESLWFHHSALQQILALDFPLDVYITDLTLYTSQTAHIKVCGTCPPTNQTNRTKRCSFRWVRKVGHVPGLLRPVRVSFSVSRSRASTPLPVSTACHTCWFPAKKHNRQQESQTIPAFLR